ncbi:MAG: hypothetical protein P9M14_18385 [Candidatus Alcyoniella australis]|nr:hypothetical protein [Candidatus Alcyoniella australis]
MSANALQLHGTTTIRDRAGDLLRLCPLYIQWGAGKGIFPWPTTGERRVDLPLGSAELNVEQLEDGLAVEFVLSVKRDADLVCAELRYDWLAETPDYAWAPHMRPGPDLVIGEMAFRSPCLVLGTKGRGVTLVPDVHRQPGGPHAFLDLQRRGLSGKALLAHGLAQQAPFGHIMFRRTGRAVHLRSGSKLRLRHYIMPWRGDPLQRAASFTWERLSRRDSLLPQVLPFERYEALAVERIFAPDLYHELEVDGREAACMATQTLTAKKPPALMNAGQVRSYLRNQDRLIKAMGAIQSRLFTNRVGYRLLTAVLHAGKLKVVPMTSFACWFNQVRTALGSALHARRLGDAALEARCTKIVELALSAPTEHGVPHSICLFPEGQVSWKRGTRSFEIIDSFHLPDAAVTCFHLLQWRELIGDDQRILPLCRGLAQTLIECQAEDGSIPAWVDVVNDRLDPQEILRRSASSAAPAMLLARLNRVEPEQRLYDAAAAAMEFIEREVLPQERWFDYELLYSCAGRPTPDQGPDRYTGCLPQNTLCMYWAAQACLDLHLAAGEARWLELGRRVLDRLSLYQQAFDHPRLSIDSFGGFGVMNADGEHNDARQGLFAPLYCDYYAATGEPALFARGVAALRACFTTMLVEEHRDLAPGNMLRFRPSDRGAILENYAHNGRDQMTAGYLSPDWGCGTSLYASGLAFARFGQVYVDLPRRRAFGIDLCSAQIESLEDGVLELTTSGAKPRVVLLHDPQSEVKTMRLNGRELKSEQAPNIARRRYS